jgi:hypothetical protein
MENGYTINITLTFCSVSEAKSLERELMKDSSYNLNNISVDAFLRLIEVQDVLQKKESSHE